MPRLEVVERTLYAFDELCDESKERAIEAARARGFGECPWGEEWADSIKRGGDALGFKPTRWEAGCNSFVRVECALDDEVSELRGVRAYKWFQNNDYRSFLGGDCPFTGFCGDEALLDPLRAFMDRPDDQSVEEVLRSCAESWLSALDADIEYADSDDALAEFLEANQHEFTKDGRLA